MISSDNWLICHSRKCNDQGSVRYNDISSNGYVIVYRGILQPKEWSLQEAQAVKNFKT